MSATDRSSIEFDREVETSRSSFDADREARFDADRERESSGKSVGQMFQEASRYIRETDRDHVIANLGAQVRDNPLPLALIGVGLVWLMSGRRLPHLPDIHMPHLHMPHMPRFGQYSRGYSADYNSDYEFDRDEYEYRGSSRGYASVYSGASHPDYSGTTYGDEEDWSSDDDRYSSGSNRGGVVRRARGTVAGAASGVTGAVGSVATGVVGAAGSVAETVSDTVGSVAGAVSDTAASVAGGIGSAASRVGRTAYETAGRLPRLPGRLVAGINCL
jgi:hypothetical protein